VSHTSSRGQLAGRAVEAARPVSKRVGRALTGAAVALLCGLPVARAQLAIDQGPIVRVLRLVDVPEAKDEELPSGALTVSQLAFNSETSPDARRREVSLLDADGFRSSAISGYEGPGRLTLFSEAIELSSAGDATRALRQQAALCSSTQAPAGTRSGTVSDRGLPHGLLVRFTPERIGAAGGMELLAQQGSYLYTLRGLDSPDRVSRRTLERLLRTVIARA
jgi:hypothetical protein